MQTSQTELFPLTTAEKVQRGKELASLTKQFFRAESRKKEVLREFNADLRRLRSEMGELSEVVLSEQEAREAYEEALRSADDLEDGL